MPIKNHIGVSGGKDSTALLLWAVHESGYEKDTLDITFCDTDNEHQITYDFIRSLDAHLQAHGAPNIQWLKPPLGYYDLAKKKKRFPGVKSRFCTQELKIFPSQRHVKKLIEQGFHIVMHSGVRAAESESRSKLVPREEVNENVTEFRPLLRWTIEDVWAMHKKYGIAPNPLYAMGARRVGCLPCIMSRKGEIANIARRFPETIDRIRKAELESVNWSDSGGVPHSFFVHDKIPPKFHSRKVRCADGRVMTVGNIDDVVRWALQNPTDGSEQIDLNLELDTRAEDRTACQSTYGSCE